jgi:HEAT repeat protein
MSSSRPAFGIFTADADLVVRTWDSFVAELTGVRPDEALNRPLDTVLSDVQVRGMFPVLRQVLLTGSIETLGPALTPFHTKRQRVTVGPLREQGRIVGVAVTVEDVAAPVEDTALAEKPNADGPDTLTRALDVDDWTTRQTAVRKLAEHGTAIVDAVVRTLREQHRNLNVFSGLLDLLATAGIDIVDQMIACLKDEDADLRIQSALILGERGDRRAVPALVAALDDRDVNVRFHAIEALGRLHAVEATGVLVDIAASGDFFLAFPAVNALSQLGDVSVATRLVPLLKDALLQATVAEALGALGDELVVAPLVELLNQAHAPTDVIADALSALYDRYEEQYRAGEHIASLVRRGVAPAGTQNLLDAVDHVAADRLRGIARVMGWLNGAAVQRALTRLLGQRSVRAQVVEALVRYGAGVVDLLIEQLRAEDLDTRQAAAVALGRIGDRRATRALVRALDDPELALPAAGALARLGDPAALDALIGLLPHGDPAVRQAAIAALNSIGHTDMPPRIRTLLDDASPIVRESAVKVAGYFGYSDCAARVLELCGDPAEAVRRAAVDHLPFFDHDDVVPALGRALDRDTPPVRAAAAAVLARLDETDALPLLLRALHDSDPWVRYFALRSVSVFRNAALAPAVRALLEHDPAGHVRLAAIDVLGRLDAPDAVSTLEPLTLAQESDIARSAIGALGHIQGDKAKSILQSLLQAPEPWRRIEAIGAIGCCGGSNVSATLQSAAAADADRDVVNAAIMALAAIASHEDGDAPDATHGLIALTAEPTLRATVIAALAGLPARRIGDVAQGLLHVSPVVRRASIEALSRMKHPEASLAIESALDDVVPAVRATAAAELRRLGSRRASRKLLLLAQTDPDTDVRHAAVAAISTQRRDLPTATHADAS